MPLTFGDVVQTTMVYKVFTEVQMNVWHWRVIVGGAGPASEIVQEIADYFSDTVTVGAPANRIRASVGGQVELDYMRAQVIAPFRQAFRRRDINEAGLLAADPHCNTNAVFTRRGLMAGRSERGNTYLPGLPTEKIVDGLITGAHQLQLEVNFQWMAQIHTMPASGAQLQPVIFHRHAGQVSEMIDYYVHPQARVMIRRTVGRGI